MPVLLLPLLLAAAPDAATLQAQAQKAYAAKQYAKACPLFEQVTQLRPKNGAAWADLALCMFQLEKRNEGVQVVRFGDARTCKRSSRRRQTNIRVDTSTRNAPSSPWPPVRSDWD
jgi:thioredoxin-like negative regulator of GroEL